MEDIVVLLIAVMVLWFLLRALSSQKSGPYSGGGIANAVDAGVKAIESTAANAASTIGKLAVSVEHNVMSGAFAGANPGHSPESVPASSYLNAAKNQLDTGVGAGISVISGPAGVAGGVTAAIPEALGGAVQGISTGAQAAWSLPAVHGIADAIGTGAADAWHGVVSAWKWLSQKTGQAWL